MCLRHRWCRKGRCRPGRVASGSACAEITETDPGTSDTDVAIRAAVTTMSPRSVASAAPAAFCASTADGNIAIVSADVAMQRDSLDMSSPPCRLLRCTRDRAPTANLRQVPISRRRPLDDMGARHSPYPPECARPTCPEPLLAIPATGFARQSNRCLSVSDPTSDIGANRRAGGVSSAP